MSVSEREKDLMKEYERWKELYESAVAMTHRLQNERQLLRGRVEAALLGIAQHDEAIDEQPPVECTRQSTTTDTYDRSAVHHNLDNLIRWISNMSRKT